MGRRRMGRETAFKELYRIDVTGRGLESALGEIGGATGADEEAVGFARDLLETVEAHRTRVDEAVNAACDRWKVDRLGVVDRAILRLGAAEILFWRTIPNQVSIDEYVEIAKKYGSDESGGFVNAILDRVSREGERPEVER